MIETYNELKLYLAEDYKANHISNGLIRGYVRGGNCKICYLPTNLRISIKYKASHSILFDENKIKKNANKIWNFY